jgi:hypothetical protein
VSPDDVAYLIVVSPGALAVVFWIVWGVQKYREWRWRA